MVLECYSWILPLVKKILGTDHDDDDDDPAAVKVKKTTGDSDEHNPTAVVIKSSSKTNFPGQINQIFKKWLVFSSSLSNYIELQRSRDRPLIIRYYVPFNHPRIFFTDGKSEKECKPWGNHLKALEYARLINFCNGLVLLTSSSPSHQHVIFNPLHNRITKRISPLFSGGVPCALFFHHVEKEHRILNVCEVETDYYEYHLYLFGSQTWRKTANPYFNSRPPDYRWSNSKEITNGNPAMANGALHWYMNKGRILVFDVIKERFCFKILPYGGLYGEKGFCLSDIFVNKEDRLCWCYMVSPEPVMDIWVLEDYTKWSWIRKYVVNMDWDAIKYPLEKGLRVGPHILADVHVVSIHEDELVLFWDGRGMFIYHLGDNTIEKIKLRKTSELDDDDYPVKFRIMGCTANNKTPMNV